MASGSSGGDAGAKGGQRKGGKGRWAAAPPGKTVRGSKKSGRDVTGPCPSTAAAAASAAAAAARAAARRGCSAATAAASESDTGRVAAAAMWMSARHRGLL